MREKTLSKENSIIVTYCEWVLKFSIYLLVFSIPLFFAPWTYDVGDFNKQALLIACSFIGLVAWILKTLVSGKFSVRLNKIHVVILVLLLVFLLSTLFSVWPTTSFWGAGQFVSPAFVSLLAFAIFYFLTSTTFGEKEIKISLRVVAISATLVFLLGLAQITGWHGVNTIGSLGDFGFFAASLLPLFLMLSVLSKKWWRALFLLDLVLVLITLLLINYYFVWLICLAGCIAVMLLGALRRDLFDVRWMGVPIFFAVVSLFFILFNPQIAWLPKSSLEVSLSNKSTMEIGLQTLKSSGVVGSGPATFSYDFSKYKNADFNQTSLWDLNFNAGSSKILTAIAEVGVAGLLALLAVLLLPIFYAVKYLFYEKGTDKMHLILGLAAVLVSQGFGYFFHSSNISLDFLYFFTVALLVVLVFKTGKTYTLKPSSLATIAIIFVFVLAGLCNASIVFLESQRYVANVNYQKGITLFSQGKQDESLAYIKKAASSNTSDMYFNQLSLFSLVALQGKAASAHVTDPNAKQAIQNLINDAVGASNSAVAFNPKNYENWSTRGYLCQNLVGLFPSAPDCVLQAYQKAIELNPKNPYLLFQLGIAYYQSKNPDKALEYFQRMLDIAPEYAKQQQIPKIIDNIKAGKASPK